MPAIDGADTVIDNADKLVQAATILNVPVVVTEQYPEGLGRTVEDLLPACTKAISKTTFDACQSPEYLSSVKDIDVIVVAGCESHVCVLQTVLGLIDLGKTVYLVADAVGSRSAENREIALRRMSQAGAVLVTSEMVLFEWIADARDADFKAVQDLLK